MKQNEFYLYYNVSRHKTPKHTHTHIDTAYMNHVCHLNIDRGCSKNKEAELAHNQMRPKMHYK